MASDNQSFPKLPSTVWWSFRKKLHQSLPKEVTVQYLETALGLGPSAAKTYLNPLKRLGLVGDDGKITDRGIKWRGEQDDYEEACAEIIDEIYPHELNDAISDAREEKDKVIKWFMSRLRIGKDAATHMASFYVLLREADLSKEPEVNGTQKAKTKPDTKAKDKQKAPIQQSRAEAETTTTNIDIQPTIKPEKNSRFQPKIHIDVQIHISPESTADQIDQIFASMAKHLTNIKE